jgi:hypothetical protein
MGHTAAIRFTQPIDPRIVWEAARIAVNAPEGWTWHGLPPEVADWNARHGVCSQLRQSDPCGATALVTMFYTPEGALLDDSDWEDDPCRPPAAYIQVDLDTRWERADANIEAAYAIIKAVGVPAAITECVGNSEWIEVPS